MSLILLVSIAIRSVALVWSLWLLWRLRDWRPGFLALLLALMTARQSWTLALTASEQTLKIDTHLDELPGLAVSIMVLMVVLLMQGMVQQLQVGSERQRAEPGRVPGVKRLVATAIAAGIVAVVAGFLVAYLAYSHMRRVVLDAVATDNLALSRTIVRHVVEQLDETTSGAQLRRQALEAIRNEWRLTQPSLPGSYLCVIEPPGRLALHTLYPEQVGSDLSGMVVDPQSPRSRTVAQLLAAKQDYAGRNVSFRGVPQLIGCAYLPPLDALVAVHVPTSLVDHQIHAVAGPWALAILIILACLLPVALGLMHLSYVSAQQAMQRVHAERERLFNLSLDMLCIADQQGVLKRVNPAFTRVLGYSQQELAGQSLLELVHAEDRPATEQQLERLRAGRDMEYFENRCRTSDGNWRWLAWTCPAPATGETTLYAVARDITDQKRSQALQEGQNRVLRQIATGQPLDQILQQLVVLAEEQTDGMLGSVLLCDERREKLWLGAAPHLPQEYNQIIDGFPIGPDCAVCGTAAYRNERVVAEDTLHDPLVAPYKDVAERFQLRACWSQPIRSADGQVLGTFALYYHEPRKPTAKEIETIETAAYLAGIAVERQRAEEALREKEHRFRTLFEHAPEAIVVLDVDQNRFVDFNENAIRLFQLDGESLRQADLEQLSPPVQPGGRRSAEWIRELCERTLAGQTITIPWVHRNAAGEDIPCEVRLVQLPSKTRRLIRGSITDITERKKAEAALERQVELNRKILDTTLDGYILADTKGQLKEVNPAYCTLIGYRREELLAMNIRQLEAQLSEAEIAEKIASFLDHGSARFTTRHRRKDGQLVDLDVSISVLPSDEGPLVAAFVRDITQQKRQEEERETLIRQLEQKNAELERFTYTVSHDLKSPLVTISGFVGHLRRDVERQNRSDIEEDVREIEAAVDKMGRLLEDLLELSRIGRMAQPPQEVALETLVEEVRQLLSGSIGPSVQIDVVDPLPVVYGDQTRLRELLQNLIENAVKFTASHPQPRIRIGCRKVGEESVVYVEDNGVGFDPRYVEKVFDLFEKLDPHTPGEGIGLAICKRIVEVHGGRIWAESEGKNRGARFCFTLPSCTLTRDRSTAPQAR